MEGGRVSLEHFCRLALVQMTARWHSTGEAEGSTTLGSLKNLTRISASNRWGVGWVGVGWGPSTEVGSIRREKTKPRRLARQLYGAPGKDDNVLRQRHGSWKREKGPPISGPPKVTSEWHSPPYLLSLLSQQ